MKSIEYCFIFSNLRALLYKDIALCVKMVNMGLVNGIQAMDSAMEAEEVCRCGRPRIVIGEEQLRFFVENGFRRQGSFSAVSAQLNVDWPRFHEHI